MGEMVEVKLTGKCKGCSEFEAKVSKLYSFDGPTATMVTCENELLCDHLERYLKETLSHGEKEK